MRHYTFAATAALLTFTCPSLSGPSDCVGGGAAVPPTAGALAGTYDYLACDDRGRPAVVGTVVLAVSDSSVEGTWQLRRAAGNPDAPVGPQVGSGTIAGATSQTTVIVNLNPGWADNNVGLSGTVDASGLLAGTWSHTTLTGPRSGGRFVMQRR